MPEQQILSNFIDICNCGLFPYLIWRKICDCRRFLEPRPRALGSSKSVKILEKNKLVLGAQSQSNSRPRASYFLGGTLCLIAIMAGHHLRMQAPSQPQAQGEALLDLMKI